MAKLTQREKQIICTALTIAMQDGSIFPTGEDADEDDKLRAAISIEIDRIKHKLSAAWNRLPYGE